MYRWFPSILTVVTIVQPETLVRWHRAGFRRYWRWKSNSRGITEMLHQFNENDGHSTSSDGRKMIRSSDN
jgi:hypothetical protein